MTAYELTVKNVRFDHSTTGVVPPPDPTSYAYSSEILTVPCDVKMVSNIS